ncbi:hypothetical protein ABIF65_008564 [Bradyrhizobium japonicum]|jgi:hypothetical protein|uniref:ferritin-like domain-containing protein n=1 Tax=Bradyrhizobium TaxID=374 RepID=UPI000403BB72|nr:MULTISPECIES: ferritin-like domain-containing protein [Bradyrhizobium]MBR0882014.1 hypothetical protein [Bradyrhizobium liaoningense]MBR1001195.1 hypothetical protein [Bradyrhizobium liaoningense]MBR1067977.1 hypothetical protein [Bradyrhizobium liaoningense]MCP1746473.1 hypothetical protein [Bradyrhizobium japonicum]MCP1774121.1 hypothetical protein [Bradyrhizobium japonicum]
MKTIAQFVEDRITTLSDLKDALQTAMQLEFSTIPPYLCAQWSINSDPGGVGGMIEDIVVQEMYHFALAGNMLTAIGGVPSIANAAFIPSYPTNVLPGGILQKLPVDLKPLTPDQVQVFMILRCDRRGFHHSQSHDQCQRFRGQFRGSNADQEHSRCAGGDPADQGRR